MKKTPSKKKRRLTSLFFRILGGIAIPLLLLLLVFTVLVLKRELDLQKRYYVQAGMATLQTLETSLKDVLLDPRILDSPAALNEKMRALETQLKVDRIGLVDPSRQISLLQELKGSQQFSDDELLNIQKTLSQKREGRPYYLTLSANQNQVLGYLTVLDKLRNRILVVTTQSNLVSLARALAQTLSMLGAVTLVVLTVALLIAIRLTIRIVRPIRAINRACREMLSGKLGHHVKVETGDELEIMAGNFNRMSEALLAITRQASDSNPLTQLPGNREITKELSRRLEGQEKFVYIHVDLDHFKAYNDHYGLSRGDDVLRRAGEIITSAVAEVERDGSFVGHQGGDDFVLMLAPVKAPEIAQLICKKFDEAMKEFYDKEDLDRGFFLGEDERSVSLTGEVEIKRHPLMSISLAGVSNQKKDFLSYDDVLDRAIPVKKKAKKLPYSKYLIEE